MAPVVAPALLLREFTPTSMVKRAIEKPIFTENSFRDWSTFPISSHEFAHILSNLFGTLDEKMSATRVWRLPEVITQTGLSRSTIYEMISRGEFPRQFNLGPRAVGWSSEDVLAWVDSKIGEVSPGNPKSY